LFENAWCRMIIAENEFKLANKCVVSNNFIEAVIHYNNAAKNGYADAQFNLAFCYQNGIGVGQDYEQAVYWYKKVVEQGITEAVDKLEELENKLNSKVNANQNHKTIISTTKEQEQNYKSSVDEIIEYLQEEEITCFYHFTDFDNLESIRKHGGLYSWKDCEEKGIKIPNAGGGVISRNLDKRYGLEDYVRLSFCDDHPMSYSKLTAKGKTVVLLEIDIKVALWKDTKFSDINATDAHHKIGTDLDFIKNYVNLQATKKHFLRKDDSEFKHHQAEILVKNFVPAKYILNLDNPIITKSFMTTLLEWYNKFSKNTLNFLLL
ncbi:MAG: DarT ssDNA thymidine ADP-ribosyltransferase family protein, partial [Bacteroidota bacterium]|nr:DarT ssDNA thymidine ADP-ribosyltransferase family protein [Bacteroidota bacterium]